MKIARDAARQFRARAATLLKLAIALERLDNFVVANSKPTHKRKLSRAARLKISVAQKKRWARVKGKR